MLTFSYRWAAGVLSVTVEGERASSIDFDGSGLPPLPRTHPVAKALDGYFADPGCAPEPGGLTARARGFQRRVLDALFTIPAGQPMTYAQLAASVGSPGAARAVGNALASNPLPVLVPCHRVVASSGLGGYRGGPEAKKALLALEGYRPV